MPPDEEFLLKELEYRREKQWKIFSWAGTLLTAITAGLIAIKTTPENPSPFPALFCVAITLAVIALGAYSVAWISHNRNVEYDTIEKMSNLDSLKSIDNLKLPEPKLGYNAAIIALGIAAVITIWTPMASSPIEATIEYRKEDGQQSVHTTFSPKDDAELAPFRDAASKIVSP